MWFFGGTPGEWEQFIHGRIGDGFANSLNYQCERCQVWGTADSEETLFCWACGSSNHLVRGGRAFLKDNGGSLTPASFDRLETADRLVA